jgi:predicted GH43/DUF377 family glycosyl hydrolase
MAFYFCESCGRRINASDLAEGRARNKQVKGIYCSDCAKGVNTITFDAITLDEAKAIRRELDENKTPATAGTLAAQYGARARHKPAGPEPKRKPRGCDVDPWCVLLPWVMREDGRWRMWYAAGIEWREVEGKLQSYYHIKYAESEDGRAWKREGLVCIPLREGESNIGHPCVVRHDGRYHMWYSYDRGQRYRIGYAESEDGLAWTRRDAEVGISVSEAGWDSEMVCQPYVFRHRDRWLMLYNGNAFGRDGIGLAVAHDE